MEKAAEEEKRLAAERMAAGGDAGGTQENLSKDKFNELNHLLDQSALFTDFLSEQMTNVENKVQGASATKKRKVMARSDEDLMKEQTELMPLLTGGALREYQLKGVKWMIALWQNGLNGILADQMGLGKTLQTISFLAHLRSKSITQKFLILAPLSTLANWVKEVKRFCPDFPVMLFHGDKEKRKELKDELDRLMPEKVWGTDGEGKRTVINEIDNKNFPLIVTSFEVCLSEIRYLRKLHYKYIVVDEGHRLKNHECRLFKELKTLSTDNRLLLSGTPLQNNLKELWSLLNFIMPDVFGSLDDFESWFDFNADSVDEQRDLVVKKLHNIMRPFVLRRLKTEVAKDLPKKKEIILYAHMTPVQADFNKQLTEKTLEAVMRQKQAMYTSSTLASFRNTVMQLRKNANHPDLITAPFEQDIFFPPVQKLLDDCGKMQLVDRLLSHLRKGNHKVLMFSQMTKMLDLLGYFLEERGYNTFRIDGSVPQATRQERIESFNNDKEHGVFLLSTRAGGLGINLTSADTVIIYDSDWNPHQDMQAMDRCHRIGQTKPVHVYRLATANSVDGKMLARAKDKLKLEKIVITKGNFKQDYDNDKRAVTASKEDIIALLRPDTDAGQVLAQSGVLTDEMLVRVCDRSDLLDGFKGEPLPTIGVGYRVPEVDTGANLLGEVEDE